MFLVLLIILSSILAYFLWSRRRYYLLAWKYRGPLGLPLIGIAWKFKSPEELMRTICELKLIYKPPLTFWLGTTCMLYVDDPETLQDILNEKDCSDKSSVFDSLKSCIGDSIITAKYNKWQRFKRSFNSCFSHNMLLEFFEVFNEHSGNLTKSLDKQIEKGPFDLRDIIKPTVLDVAMQTMCGKELIFPPKVNKNILTAVTKQIELCVERMYTPWLAVEWIYRLTNFYKIHAKNREFIMSTVFNMVNSKAKLKQEEETHYIEKKSGIYLNKALDLESTGQITQQELHDNTLTFIVASYETSSCHLFLTLVCLAMYPEYQQKLIDELAENLPEDPDVDITYENIKDLKYLDMVFNESLRLMPSIPITARDVTKDITLRNGITIPKGTQILINIFNAQRSKEIWGEKANDFYPDHFLPENLTNLHPYAYVPFFKGVRTCIGYKYATFMSKVFLCRIFRKYRFVTKTKMEDLQYVEDISLKVKNPCLVEVMKI